MVMVEEEGIKMTNELIEDSKIDSDNEYLNKFLEDNIDTEKINKRLKLADETKLDGTVLKFKTMKLFTEDSPKLDVSNITTNNIIVSDIVFDGILDGSLDEDTPIGGSK